MLQRITPSMRSCATVLVLLAVGLPALDAQQEVPAPPRNDIQVFESSEELRESLQSKPALQFASGKSLVLSGEAVRLAEGMLHTTARIKVKLLRAVRLRRARH